MAVDETGEVLEPEVLPSAPAGSNPEKANTSVAKRAERAFGPVGAGLILDLVDLGTFGPMGVFFGGVIGAVVGWYLARVLGVPRRWRTWMIVAAAVYCMIPFTEFIPAATLFGALARFWDDRDREE